MKTLIQYIYEKYEASAIQQFMKVIQDNLSKNTESFNNYIISCHGIVNEKPVNIWYPLNDDYKESINQISKYFKLGKIKDEWIHTFNNGEQVLDKNEIVKLLGDISEMKIYGGLNKLAVKYKTYIFLLSKGDYLSEKIGEPVAAIFLEPNKAKEIINYWHDNLKNIAQKNMQSDKLAERNEKLDHKIYKLCIEALNEYKNNSSDKQYKLLTKIINYFTQADSRIFNNKEEGKKLSVDVLEEVHAEIINWLFFHEHKTDYYLYGKCSKEDQNILQEFWKDLENRFTIDGRKLTTKK